MYMQHFTATRLVQATTGPFSIRAMRDWQDNRLLHRQSLTLLCASLTASSVGNVASRMRCSLAYGASVPGACCVPSPARSHAVRSREGHLIPPGVWLDLYIVAPLTCFKTAAWCTLSMWRVPCW